LPRRAPSFGRALACPARPRAPKPAARPDTANDREIEPDPDRIDGAMDP